MRKSVAFQKKEPVFNKEDPISGLSFLKHLTAHRAFLEHKKEPLYESSEILYMCSLLLLLRPR